MVEECCIVVEACLFGAFLCEKEKLYLAWLFLFHVYIFYSSMAVGSKNYYICGLLRRECLQLPRKIEKIM